MALVNDLSEFIFPFDTHTDRERFQYISTIGRNGFYDSIERKFITSEVLFRFLKGIAPAKPCETNYYDYSTQEKIKSRIRKNISFFSKRPVESYSSIFLKYLSNRYLKSKDGLISENAILFADIVGSTELTLKLTPTEMSILIRVFSQEMAILLSQHSGFILKYAGDAVIGYFPVTNNIQSTCENAIRCAETMHIVISKILNPVLHEFGINQIQIRVGVDFGEDSIAYFGSDCDLIGNTITTCSKIYPCADPAHTAIGHKIYEHLNKKSAEHFIPLKNNLKKIFINPLTKKPYECYESK